MDCREAQRILDAAQADARDLWEPEVAPAAVHLKTCRDCQLSLRKKNRFDHAFGVAVRDVAVPAGLKQRMLAAIAADSPGGSSSHSFGDEPVESKAESLVALKEETPVVETSAVQDSIASPTMRVRRRRFGWISTAALMLLAALGAFWFWPAGGEPVALDELLSGFAVQGQYQTPFDENFAVKLPAEGWDSKRLKIDGPFGYATANARQDQAAVYRFQLASRRQPLQGKLVVIPLSRVANPPRTSTIFEVTAESSSDGSYSHAAWTEGEFVFVCYVDGHAGKFSALQQALAPRLG
ncbi:MAG: hypothetical protein WEB58_15870 [Planctomycetaceae bacterium]